MQDQVVRAQREYPGEADSSLSRGMSSPQGTNAQPLSPMPRPVSIQPVNHGFVVTVGCQTFAVETVDALLHRLSVYLKNPSEAEAKWLSGEWKF